MRRMIFLLIFSALSLGLLLRPTEVADLPSPAAIDSISAADLKSGLHFFASDEMQGRSINTLFNEIASQYLAHRFELMGLEAANEGSYFQSFSVAWSKLSEPNRLQVNYSTSPLLVSGVLKEDFFPSMLSATARVKAPLVYVGYGITAPEYGYDDYEGIDTTGKIALMKVHEPGENDSRSVFDGLVDSEHSQEYFKVLNAQKHGAAAVIFFPDLENHPQGFDFARLSRYHWPARADRQPYVLERWTEQIQIPVVYVSGELSDSFFSASKTDSKQTLSEDLSEHSFELPAVEIAVETSLSRRSIRVRNVLAYLPGSDPKFREETIIVSAHFDHVGVRNGEVYNGADDDASGTIGLLEIAEAYAQGPIRPRRSVLFAGWNAEERGLLGSYYYVQEPVFPLNKTVAVFQMDMIGRNEEIPDPDNPRFRGLEKQSGEENNNSVNILGYSRNPALQGLALKNNDRIGLDLRFRYDNNPSNLLRRSDNWPFLINSVPALFFHTGLHPDYHRPTDTPEKINYPKMEKIVRLVFLCSWDAAQSPTRLEINPKHE